jgi:hypothetical protein
MSAENDWHSGNKPVDEPLNVRREVATFSRDPLLPLLASIQRPEHSGLLVDDVARWEEAFEFYHLSFSRLIPAIAVAIRWRNGPYYAWKARRRYTKSEKRVADAYRVVEPYIALDFWNYLLHTRILCDRLAGLSRSFVKGQPLPSFTSFADHRQFFERGRCPSPDLADYGPALLAKTEWFGMPLKHVRDKFLVHAGPRHMRLFEQSTDHDHELILLLTDGNDPIRPLALTRLISVSARRMARDVDALLTWFCAHGLSRIRQLHHTA